MGQSIRLLGQAKHLLTMVSFNQRMQPYTGEGGLKQGANWEGAQGGNSKLGRSSGEVALGRWGIAGWEGAQGKNCRLKIKQGKESRFRTKQQPGLSLGGEHANTAIMYPENVSLRRARQYSNDAT
eukprot:805639-Pelagomonas_calceolata.AAC.5